MPGPHPADPLEPHDPLDRPHPPDPAAADRPEVVAATFCATVVDEWVRAGVTDAVVAPGSRSTPMALALAADGRLRLHVHVDERSAGFVALGLGLATGRPAVVLTTSGTAAVELHPAVVEAHHARVPLVACTADRPPELRDVGAPQTIDQTRLYGPAVRWACDPGVPDPAARASWRSLAARVVLAATGTPPGPVQLQLPFREPLVAGPGALPPGRPGGAPWHRRVGRSQVAAPAGLAEVADRLAGRRGVVVAGGGVARPGPVLALAEALGWPVLADPRSGCRVPHPAVVAHADAVARLARPDLVPEVVLALGAPPASKAVAAWVGRAGDVVLVDRDGAWADPDHRAAVVVEGEPAAVCEALAALALDPAPGPDRAWARAWEGVAAASAEAVAEVVAGWDGLTEPAVARHVVAAVPDGGALVVSSSMPVRDVEWWSAPRAGLRVVANRGANGIDGVVSTALGVALAGGPVVALVGDLAFLHDSGALVGAPARGADLTVVVVDNDGGGIFSFLPQATALAPDRFELLFGTPQGADVAAVARAHGVGATTVATAGELTGAVAASAAAGGTRVVVARTDRSGVVAAHRLLHAEVAARLAPTAP